jgi:HPt (histidine-containing phosphotransfer) domain-containing protein
MYSNLKADNEKLKAELAALRASSQQAISDAQANAGAAVAASAAAAATAQLTAETELRRRVTALETELQVTAFSTVFFLNVS